MFFKNDFEDYLYSHSKFFTLTDDRTGNRKCSGQKHGIISLPPREGCLWALLQAAFG